MAYCESVGQTKDLTALNFLSVVYEIIGEQEGAFKILNILKIYLHNLFTES